MNAIVLGENDKMKKVFRSNINPETFHLMQVRFGDHFEVEGQNLDTLATFNKKALEVQCRRKVPGAGHQWEPRRMIDLCIKRDHAKMKFDGDSLATLHDNPGYHEDDYVALGKRIRAAVLGRPDEESSSSGPASAGAAQPGDDHTPVVPEPNLSDAVKAARA
eukprot:TRINITY_DN3004_c1_g3_i2.p2 TRINITY_DN3004_c1_g3~~TRINITY_DN3004_c1_g3_i2.p2  ORF type:complete len:162 (+),score=27.95 TRINITY_DN3004_c1_g3_i2:286-771(+)